MRDASWKPGWRPQRQEIESWHQHVFTTWRTERCREVAGETRGRESTTLYCPGSAGCSGEARHEESVRHHETAQQEKNCPEHTSQGQERMVLTRTFDQLNRWKEHFQEILNRPEAENPPDINWRTFTCYRNRTDHYGRGQERVEKYEEWKGSWMRPHPPRSLEGRRDGFGQGPPLSLEQDLNYGGRSSGLEVRPPDRSQHALEDLSALRSSREDCQVDSGFPRRFPSKSPPWGRCDGAVRYEDRGPSGMPTKPCSLPCGTGLGNTTIDRDPVYPAPEAGRPGIRWWSSSSELQGLANETEARGTPGAGGQDWAQSECIQNQGDKNSIPCKHGRYLWR